MKDFATIIGLVAGTVLLLGAIVIDGDGSINIGSMLPFVNVPSIMIVVGGSVAVTFINYPMRTCFGLMKVIKNCFLSKLPDPGEVIEQFKTFTQIARKDGIVALESNLVEVDDEFLLRGLEMVIGGSARDEIQSVMELELNYIDERHISGKKIIDSLAAAAPAFGMIGTLIGLIQMLRTLDDPSKIGAGMSVALLTTLYGAIIANMFCIPLAGKLGDRNESEQMIRSLMITGLGLLSEGQSPRVMEEHLSAYLSSVVREDLVNMNQAA